MPIEKRLYPVPFAGGIDTKTDPKQVLSGKLLDLQNGIFSQTGLISRRWGYTALGTGIIGGGTIASAQAIAQFNSELLLFDGKNAYSYVQGQSAWSNRGAMTPITQSNKSIIAGNYQQLSPDFASLGGIDVYVWEDSRGGIRGSVFDTASGVALKLDFQIRGTGSGRPKCVPLTTQGVIGVFLDNGLGGIEVWTINPATPTAITFLSVVVGSVNTPEYFDVSVAPNGNIYIAYRKVVSTKQTTIVSLVNAGLTGLTWSTTLFTSGSGTAFVGGICVVADATSNAWVSFNDPTAGNVYGAETNSAGTIAVAATVIGASGNTGTTSICGAVIGTTLTVFSAYFNGSHSTNNSTLLSTLTHGGTTTNAVFAWGLCPASKPFVYNSVIYVNMAFQTQQQAQYLLMTSTGQIVSRTLYGQGGGYLSNQDWMVPECQALSTGVYAYANTVKGIPNTEAGIVLSLLGVNQTKLDLIDANAFASAPINGSLHTTGGIVQRYDGSKYVETGFLAYPEEASYTPFASGGSMAAGTYFYCVTYEYDDNLGNNEISSPSVAVSVTTTTGSSSVDVSIPTLFMTNKTGVRLVVYRTTAGGTTFYRVSSAALPTYNPWPAATTVATTFVDTLSDAAIVANGAMYTQPLALGANPVLPNVAPPSCRLIASYADRLWIAGLDDAYTLWYSQQSIEGSTAQFCEALNLRMDPDGGGITAIARMDSSLFIFKTNAIFYLTGQGPTATGDQNDLGTPTQVPSGNVGCANPSSVALTPMGLLFQANTGGIYLLDRSLNVIYKGAPVEKFSSLTITSTTMLPNQWVVFTTTSGLALVYDYFYDQWSTFTNHPAVDADVFAGMSGAPYVWANAAGTVFVQTPSTFTDNGTAIPFSLSTSWFDVTAIQGYQRVYHCYVLGQWISAHTLNVTGYFDYDVSRSVSAPIPALTAPTSPAVFQYRLDVLTKCQSFQLVLTDTQSNPGGAGFSLSGLSLVVGVKAGGNKLPAVRQFGVS